METTTARNPILLSLKWVDSKTRDGKKLCSTAKYSVKGSYAYRRRPHLLKTYEYHRVPISRVYLLTYWYEIEESWWESVDVYGVPVIAKP